jgi:hypothetical protein
MADDHALTRSRGLFVAFALETGSSVLLAAAVTDHRALCNVGHIMRRCDTCALDSPTQATLGTLKAGFETTTAPPFKLVPREIICSISHRMHSYELPNSEGPDSSARYKFS